MTFDKLHTGKLQTHWVGQTVWSLRQRSADNFTEMGCSL